MPWGQRTHCFLLKCAFGRCTLMFPEEVFLEVVPVPRSEQTHCSPHRHHKQVWLRDKVKHVPRLLYSHLSVARGRRGKSFEPCCRISGPSCLQIVRWFFIPGHCWFSRCSICEREEGLWKAEDIGGEFPEHLAGSTRCLKCKRKLKLKTKPNLSNFTETTATRLSPTGILSTTGQFHQGKK